MQWQLPGVHGRGARPADDASGEHVGGERRVAERAVGHAHVGDVGHAQTAGASASNLRSTRSDLPPVPFAGLVVTGVLPLLTPWMPSPRMTEST